MITMVLVPLDGGRPYPLDKAIVFFGRGAECDIVLNSSRKVSRKHCCVAQIDDYFIVRDLGSMNGVKVNERPVTGEVRLKTGDEIWVGDLGFRFQTLTPDIAKSLRQEEPNRASRKSAQKGEGVGASAQKGRGSRSFGEDSAPTLPKERSQARSARKAPEPVIPVIPDDEIVELDDDDIIED